MDLTAEEKGALQLMDIIDDGNTGEQHIRMHLYKVASVNNGGFCVKAKPSRRAQKEDCWAMSARMD